MTVLTANGLSSPALQNALTPFCRGGRAALVTTADYEYKERNYHVPRLTGELQALGFAVDCFDFDRQTPEELQAYNAVELIGGNPYYLLRAIRERGFEASLRAFAAERLLIGVSAGAAVLTPSLALLDCFTPEMNFVGLRELAALGLTDLQVLPHYAKMQKRFPDLETACARYEREQHCTVLRLNDGDGALLTADALTVIRGNAD